MATVIGSVTINRNPSIETKWWVERINHYTLITADGGRVTYDNGANILKGILVLKNVAKSEGDSLRTYITDTAIFGKNSFTIDPPANTDLGSGTGTNVTSAYYDGGADIQDNFIMTPNGTMYTITLPYWKKL